MSKTLEEITEIARQEFGDIRVGVPVLKQCPICGLKAISKDMLVLFPKKSRDDRINFCNVCDVLYQHPLVKCKVCGDKAYTKEDLHRFVPRTGTKHGRGRLCLECQKRTNNRAYEKRRQHLLKILAEMAQDEYLYNRLKRSSFIRSKKDIEKIDIYD